MGRLLTIAIVYHSNNGHTAEAARLLSEALNLQGVSSKLVHTKEVNEHWETLHQADMIVFGSPTYFGNVSAKFKEFMEATGIFWYRQLWRDKFAAGFTISSTLNGDKLHTLQSLAIFAAQHSMNWVSLGILPVFSTDYQTEGQNRMASYLGLMMQSDNSQTTVEPFAPGDLLTLQLFAQRLSNLLLSFKT